MSAQWPSRKRGMRVARESPKLRALCILHDHAVHFRAKFSRGQRMGTIYRGVHGLDGLEPSSYLKLPLLVIPFTSLLTPDYSQRMTE